MKPTLKNIPHLDTLRFFAAFGVILHHFLPDYRIGELQIGAYGVQVFFAISGFLITFILLQQKDSDSSRGLIIRNFFIKRVLRLFPVYYLLLIALHIINDFFWIHIYYNDNYLYYYTYASNFLFFLKGFQSPTLNHTWTLAVEEQFYLIWPWLLMYFPSKKENKLFIFFILIALCSKLVRKELYFFPIAQFDTLAIGALLAYLIRNNYNNSIEFLYKYRYYLTSIASIVIISSTWLNVHNFFISLSLMTVSVLLILGCYKGFQGGVKRIFDNKILQYLGKISYGLYLYHKPIPFFIKIVLSRLAIEVNPYVLFIVSVMLTIIVSHLSYKLLELRFLKMKKRFDIKVS